VLYLTENSSIIDENKENPHLLHKNTKETKEINKEINVRSSCEHIIETARFNKPEEEKEKKPEENQEFLMKNSNSPLSFSMSAIKINETPGSKTFTLSDFGEHFLNIKLEDLNKSNFLTKLAKSSTSKSSSKTMFINQGFAKNLLFDKENCKISKNLHFDKENLQEKSNEKTIIQKKFQRRFVEKEEGFMEILGKIEGISERISEKLKNFVSFDQEKSYGVCLKEIDFKEFEKSCEENENVEKLFEKTMVKKKSLFLLIFLRFFKLRQLNFQIARIFPLIFFRKTC